MINFSKITISGFKSFADKTTITFSDGVTGIVGPNGCGKSNISDAIRWVLGESRAKQIRGDQMSDVIFFGTGKRKPVNTCEVSLVFDNQQGMFNRPEREITITRKLHRNKSKSSEYFINGVSCTRSEILEMLSDTGVGREGYSIIGQGKIKDILSNKPEERRAIFEDAAGVSSLRKNKEDSEKDLAVTQINIARCQDAINIIGEQLEPLKAKSITAKKYLDIYEELKKLEINAYLYSRENSDIINRELSVKLNKLIESKQKIEQELADTNLAIANATEKCDEIDRTTSRLIDDQNAIKVNLAHKSGNKNLLIERQKHASENLRTALQNIEYAEREIKENNAKLEENNQKLVELYAEVESKTTEINNIDSEIEYIQKEIRASQTIIFSGKDELAKLMEKQNSITADLSGLKVEYKEKQQRIIELEQEIAGFDSQIEKLTQSEVHIKKNLQDKGVEIQAADRNVGLSKKMEEDAKASREELIEEIRAKSSEIASIKGTLSAYEQSEKNKKPAYKHLQIDKRSNAELSMKMLGILAEIIQVPEKYETAIEMSLGAAMQFVVTNNEDDAKYILQYLKLMNYGRITVLPITTMKPRHLEPQYRQALRETGCLGIASDLVQYESKYENIISSQLGNTLVIDNIDNATNIARKYDYNIRMVTLQGDIIATTGAISGGSKKDSMLAQEKQISKYQRALEVLCKEYDAARENLALCDKEIKECSENITRLVAKSNEKNLEYNNESFNLRNVQNELERLNNEYSTKTHELETTKERVKVIAAQLEEIEHIDRTLKASTNMSDTQYADTAKKLEDDRTKEEELNKKQFALSMELKELNNMIANINESNDILITNNNTKQMSAKYNTEMSVKYREDIDALKEELDRQSVGDSYECNEDLIKIGKQLEELAREKEIQRDIVASKSAHKEELNIALPEMAGKIAKEEAKIEISTAKFREMEDHINEEYQLQEEQLLEFKLEEFDYNTAMLEIEKLKKKKNAFGPVDITAIEEYEQMSAEFNSRNDQLIDCYTTKAKLEDLITNLTKEILSKFKKEFRKISEHFEQVYKELFNGGQGELALIDNPEDPLDYDIEISAVPNGKTLKKLSLLSGGERTMTAIAILLAILKLKPLPFCMLDEMDADLDDANVLLLATYIKKYSDSTQFIIITHKKPTMELCDNIFGVTMEEKGVTKMFKINYNQAVKMTAPKQE